VVKGAAKKAATVDALCQTVSKEIVDEKERAFFIRKFSATEQTLPPSRPVPTAPTRSQPSAPKFTDETLRQAEVALAQYIGAIAKVVVKRAAAQARDEAELYLLIADEIKDVNERKGFIRKAINASRRR